MLQRIGCQMLCLIIIIIIEKDVENLGSFGFADSTPLVACLSMWLSAIVAAKYLTWALCSVIKACLFVHHGKDFHALLVQISEASTLVVLKICNSAICFVHFSHTLSISF